MSGLKQTLYTGGIAITTILLILAIIVIIILVGGFLFNYTRIDQLTRSLQDTQKQVQEVRNESDQAKANLQGQAKEGLSNIADAIKDVENPAVRLALVKAYAARLNSFLTPSERNDLNTVVVYIEKNPDVLFSENPNLPQDVRTALNRIRTKVTSLTGNSVATMQEIDEAIYSPGETVTITGTIEYVGEDEVLGGGIFTLTDSETGYVYYLHFNQANSQNIQENMVGEEVSVNIRVTSRANEPLTFQVVSGPTQSDTQDAETTSAPQPTASN